MKQLIKKIGLLEYLKMLKIFRDFKFHLYHNLDNC